MLDIYTDLIKKEDVMKYFIIILILISSNLAFSHSKIEMKDGNKYFGIIEDRSNDSLSIRTIDGFSIKLAKANIRDVVFVESYIKTVSGDEYTVVILEDNIDTYKVKSGASIFEIPKNKVLFVRHEGMDTFSGGYKQKYGLFGLTIGMPGGINLNGGYRFDNIFGLRGNFGMVPDEMWGFQGNLDFLISKKEFFEHGMSVTFGFLEIEEDYYDIYYGYQYTYDKEWLYIGPSYFLNFYGAFIEVGMTIGTGNFSSPQLNFQIGYIHRFN